MSHRSDPSVTVADAGTPDRPREIQVEDLNKSFDENHVLRGVDVVIHRGEIVAIVGDSGSGKTVLLRHIIGQLQPDRGRVLVADHEAEGAPLRDLSTLDEEQMDHLRIHWAIVFQRNALLSGSVYDNMYVWLLELKNMDEGAIRQRAHDVLEAVGLKPEEVLKLDRSELSGGMAKRVAIARALAMDPLVMFYDEPTPGLDPKHAQLIHELIYSVHHQKPDSGSERTTLIITHDKDLLTRLQPRIVMLHDGRVFFDGTYEAFKQSKSKVIRPYFDLMPILHRRPIPSAAGA
jgi:phospholipid/cholesterol/gamma-HCH transport system ATP-binding protein